MNSEFINCESLEQITRCEENEALKIQAQAGAHKAFGLYRVLPIAAGDDHRIFHVLHFAGLECCGERWTDLERWLSDSLQTVEIPSVADVQWDKRLLYGLFVVGFVCFEGKIRMV